MPSGPPPYAFLLGLAVATALVVSAFVWFATRRRDRSLRRGVLVVLAMLLFMSVVPAPLPSGHARLEGSLAGVASFAVDVDARARLVVDGGTGSLEQDGTRLVLVCPEGCSFVLGSVEGRVPPLVRSATLADVVRPEADLSGGPLEVRDVHGFCFRTPWLLAFAVPGSGCSACSVDVYVAPAGEGRVRLVHQGSRDC